MRSTAVPGVRLPPALLALLLVAGCTSTDPTAGLSPSADIGSARRLPAMSGESAGEPVASASVSPATVPGAALIGPIQFLPVVGAPASTVEALSAALAAEAQRTGVAIVPSDAPATPVRLKGYLSALVDGRDTLVIYVWDVVDPGGDRISRIQGQERVAGAGSATDPWSGVTREALTAVARRTVGEIARAGAPG